MKTISHDTRNQHHRINITNVPSLVQKYCWQHALQFPPFKLHTRQILTPLKNINALNRIIDRGNEIKKGCSRYVWMKDVMDRLCVKLFKTLTIYYTVNSSCSPLVSIPVWWNKKSLAQCHQNTWADFSVKCVKGCWSSKLWSLLTLYTGLFFTLLLGW